MNSYADSLIFEIISEPTLGDYRMWGNLWTPKKGQQEEASKVDDSDTDEGEEKGDVEMGDVNKRRDGGEEKGRGGKKGGDDDADDADDEEEHGEIKSRRDGPRTGNRHFILKKVKFYSGRATSVLWVRRGREAFEVLIANCKNSRSRKKVTVLKLFYKGAVNAYFLTGSFFKKTVVFEAEDND